MASEFPFGDRRQRPCVMGTAVVSSHQKATVARPDVGTAAPSHDHIDPARAVARGRSYVDIATVPGGSCLPHRDVLG